MTYDPNRHHRRSIRLRGYDYAQPGAYFITIVARNRVCLFGEVEHNSMRLNQCGEIVATEWARTAVIRPSVSVDAFAVMPNHLHGIIIIHDAINVGARCDVPLQECVPTTEQFGRPTPNSIPTIVRLFKSATTKRINEMRRTPGIPVWQRNYYEHVIRNEAELNLVRQYVVDNPFNWQNDQENPTAQVIKDKEPWQV